MPSLMAVRATGGRVLLVAALIAGVLAMHGLSPATAASHSDSSSIVGLASVTGSSDAHDADHGTLAHVGAVCLWLIAAGVTFTALLRFVAGRRSSAPPLPTFAALAAIDPQRTGRPPDRLLTTGQLRC